MIRQSLFKVAPLAALLLVLGHLVGSPGGDTARAATSELFLSEYVEGSSNNKAIEIYNGTNSAIDLAAGLYDLQYFFNGSATAGLTIALTGTVASADVYVVAQSSASATILAQADQTNGSGWYNGDDAVVLRKNGVVIDSIGQVGVDPGTEWGTGLTSTADNTLRRKFAICAGDTNSTDAFDPAVEWDGYATDTFGGLGSHASTCGPDSAPQVSGTTPADGAGGVAANANITINFSEDVTVTGAWYDITCASSGAHTATVSGGPSSYTLDPDTDFTSSETCTVTVYAAQVTDVDVDDPPDNMAADYVFDFTVAAACGDPATLIHDIQGSGTSTPFSGQVHSVEGVVVGDFQTSANFSGFFVQEEDTDADADPATSEGLFVFDGGSPAVDVAVGDVVRVTGTVTEFSGLTELTSVTSVQVCSSGASVTASTVTLPFATSTDAERYEGMAVTLPQTLYVTETFNLGRFGEVLLSSSGRLLQPTNVVDPGAPANAMQAANDLNKILLDDGRNPQNPDPTPYMFDSTPDLVNDPTLRVGDTVTGLTGVMHFAFSAYRIQPTATPVFTRANPRTSAPDAVGGTLKVASLNLLNYFNGDGLGGGFPTSRGASTLAEFQRQRDKTIAALLAMDADVFAVTELENDATDGSSAVEDLVSGLNTAAGSTVFDFVDTGVIGTDEIRVAILYRLGTVTPVGATGVLLAGTFSTLSRPPVAQAFVENATGGAFVVAANHFKSKSCSGATGSDLDQGDGQACYNATRVQSATELLAWLATDPTATGDPDVLILGDLNAYLQEDPITTLEAGGYTNLVENLLGTSSTSFVFQGQSGTLDHALASASLAGSVTGVTHWRINSDEPRVLDYNVEFKSAGQQALEVGTPYRSADHDATVVGLDFDSSLQNGGMEIDANGNLMPDGWAAAGIRRGPNWDGRVCDEALSGNCSFRMRGDNRMKTLLQRAAASGSAGNAYSLTFWVKTDRVAERGLLRAVVTYQTPSGPRIRVLNLPKGTNDWAPYALDFTVPADPTSIQVQFSFKAGRGTVWIDAVAVVPN